jgi:membrane protein implicated in regulation of membrane protease activity
MTTVYAICAVVGGTIFICQFIMSLVGMGGAEAELGAAEAGFDDVHQVGEAHHGMDPSLFFGILTFKTIVAALTFFGLAGLAAEAAAFTPGVTLAVAMASGIAAMFIVAMVMRALISLQEDATERIQDAIGKMGTVYLAVPGNKTGYGKVMLNLQSRTAEFQAVTFQDKLPTGSKVVVVDVVGPDTLEVIAAPETGRMGNE